MARGIQGTGNDDAEGEEDTAAVKRDPSYMTSSDEASSARSSKDGSTLSTSIEAPSNVSTETTPWDAPSRESRAAGTGAGVDGPDSWPEAKQVESSTLESNESGFVDKARLLQNIDKAMAARGQSAERDGGAAGIDSGGGEQSRSDAAAMEKTSPEERGARAVNAPKKPPVEDYIDRDPARHGKIADAPEVSREANQPAGGFHITAQPAAAGLGSDQPAAFDEGAHGQRDRNKAVEEWRGDTAKTQEAMSPEEKASQANNAAGSQRVAEYVERDPARGEYVERDPARGAHLDSAVGGVEEWRSITAAAVEKMTPEERDTQAINVAGSPPVAEYVERDPARGEHVQLDSARGGNSSGAEIDQPTGEFHVTTQIDGSNVTVQGRENSASNEQSAQQAEVKQQEQPDVSREGRQLDARSREDARGR
jgi:hypothetical protein